MRSSLLTLLVFTLSPLAQARVSTVQELRYLTEVLGTLASEGGYTLDAESISVHGYSVREEASYGFHWWNTPAGNQDHTILFKVIKDDVAQMRTINFMSQASKFGRPCRLYNKTSRRMVSAFDGHENCVTLYLKPRRKHMVKDPAMENIRVPHVLLWDAFGSKKP